MNKLIFPIKILIFLTLSISLNSCEALKYKPTKAGEVPVNVKDRVKKNIEEGKGFRLMGGNKKGGTFDFASSNELWRATLDVIDFMPHLLCLKLVSLLPQQRVTWFWRLVVFRLF